MKIQTATHGFNFEFPSVGSGSIEISEIYTIDIETLPTISVDIDYVILGYDNGKFLEVSDDAEGFKEFCQELSKALSIQPPIHYRFPVSNDTGIERIYDRSQR